ncbi:MAG: hypothetical protein IJ087_21015 [Eggerthellaceae bacterium]|nr:hypothetical protein [Eggerthellaceae bacterium]
MQSSRNAVNGLESTIGGFRSNIDGQMEQIYTTTASIQKTTDQIYQSVSEFRENMIKSEEVQLAHENVIRIDQVLKEQFGDYERIRKTIIGVVRDFDINLVRNKTIQELSEELWLTSSRYWLSYALIAVTAWVNDYPEVAANSLAECTRRDGIKACLFFTLLNLRFNRNEAARLWFCKYMKTLDPNFLQNEAAVMLQAYLSGLFGRDRTLQAQVDRTIEEWIAIINDDAQVSAELVEAYANYIGNINPGVEFSYGSIRQFCANADEVESTFRDVSRYEQLLVLVESLDVEDAEQNPENYAARIDTVLTSLISNYDRDEEELKNQQEYYNLVIKNGGNVDAAEGQWQEMLRLKGAGFNIGRAMVNWVLYDDSDETEVHVRKFGLAHTKSWLIRALDDFSNGVQSRFPSGYKLSIDTWEGLSNGNDQTKLTEDLKSYFDTHKLSMVYLNVPNVVAAVFAILCIGLAFVTPWTLIGTALGLGFLVFNIVRAVKRFPQRVQQAVDNLSKTMEEISDFKEYCKEANSKRDRVKEKLNYGFIQ